MTALRALVLLLAMSAAGLAGEPAADPVTLHLPGDAYAVVRLAPPERLDAIGRDLQPLLDLAGSRAKLGDSFLGLFRAAGLPVDRTQPVYWAIGRDGAVSVVKALPGTTAEDLRAARRSGLAPVLDAGGWIKIPFPFEPGAPMATNFSQPVPLLDGDASVCVLVGRIVDGNRAALDEALANIGKLEDLARGQGVPVPPPVVRLVRVLAAKALEGVLGVSEFHYAVTWRDGRLESEGWIRSREGSSLRRWLDRYAGAKPGDLMGFLPKRAFYMVESSGAAASLDADIEALLDEAFGKGAGRTLLLLLSPSYALHEHLTGRAAGVIVVQGMMAMSMRAVHETKPEAAIEAAIGAIDTRKGNALLESLGIPVRLSLVRGFARSGDTPIHRLSYSTADPQLMMFAAQMDTCFAADGRHLLVVQSATPESDLRALLDRVRGGDLAEHPHDAAMKRLMPDRLEGLTINLGTLKPMFGLFAMAAPEAARYVSIFPDDLYLSTALAVRGGHIHIRGDWPVKEIVDFAVEAERISR